MPEWGMVTGQGPSYNLSIDTLRNHSPDAEAHGTLSKGHVVAYSSSSTGMAAHLESPTLATCKVLPRTRHAMAVVPLMESSMLLMCSCSLHCVMAPRKASTGLLAKLGLASRLAGTLSLANCAQLVPNWPCPSKTPKKSCSGSPPKRRYAHTASWAWLHA